MPRPLRIIQIEYPNHLVCRTNNREFRFHKKKIIRIFFKALCQAAEKYSVRVHHVVLMSNHYHVIAQATELNLHRFMQYLNSRVAQRYNRAVGHTGHVWSDRYKSCIIETDEHYLHAVRYIYENPRRAGIVKDLGQFEESSFQFYAFGKKVDMVLTPDHLVLNLGGDEGKVAEFFKNLMQDGAASRPHDEEMRVLLRKRFYGSADFVQRMVDTYLR